MMTTPHVHKEKILEWAADPNAVWHSKSQITGKWITCTGEPGWQPDVEYRRKPRWFDMEQEWVAKGKPPVEYNHSFNGWMECIPTWGELYEYRFKEVSRHAALKAEWEAKGRPDTQSKNHKGEWEDIGKLYQNSWLENFEIRIKPTPHPDAEKFLALAKDGSLGVQYFDDDCGYWIDIDSSMLLRIKPEEEWHE